MNSYLELVPLSAKAHKKQNRMTVFCIVLAVFLVTTIFGMADMYIRSQLLQARQEYGNWHIVLRNVSDEQARAAAARTDVECVSCYGILNYRGEDGYSLGDKPAAIIGCDEAMLTDIMEDAVAEGRFPETGDEAMVSLNAKKELGLEQGDKVSARFPDGSVRDFIVTGFIQNTANLLSEDSYGLALNTQGFRAVYPEPAGDSPADYNSVFYVQFSGTSGIQDSIGALKEQLGLEDGQVSENTKLMALLGQGASAFTFQIYGTAAVLFVLVLIAESMMIAGSLNSSVAGRTRFFGMLRCIGASRWQVKRLVRLEALNWCALALPLGVGAGVVLIWLLCLLLRLLSPDYFSALPVLGVSLPSIAAGCALGLMTVFLAAQAPARRASKVSPLTAASGSTEDGGVKGRAAGMSRLPVDTALGLRHAVRSGKNYVLMSGSFALSIILFLSFSVTIDFMKHALTPLYPWTPDITVSALDGGELIPPGLTEKMRSRPAVERCYGRMAANSLPAVIDGQAALAHMISYEEAQFAWAEKYLLEGSVSDVRDSIGSALVVYDPQSSLTVGSTLTVEAGGKEAEVRIGGLLSTSPFRTDDGGIILICSEDSLREIAGVEEYSVVDAQLARGAGDDDVDALRALAGQGYSFADERMSNASVLGAYYSFGLFIYGFLALIALVTVFNISNSIALSVSARTRQYGVLRAIGLGGRQLTRMIVAEAVAYTLTGTVLGTALGLGLNRLLFSMIISFNWGDAWRIPVVELLIILAVIALAVLLAVRKPIRRIKNTPIVDTISAL